MMSRKAWGVLLAAVVGSALALSTPAAAQTVVKIGLINSYTGFVAQAEIMLVARHGLVNGKATQLEFRRTANRIGTNDISRKVADHDAKRRSLNADIERRSSKADGSIILDRLDLRRFGARTSQDRP